MIPVATRCHKNTKFFYPADIFGTTGYQYELGIVSFWSGKEAKQNFWLTFLTFSATTNILDVLWIYFILFHSKGSSSG